MNLINKEVFLKTIMCPTLGWLTNSQTLSSRPQSISERLRLEEGIELHKRARMQFPAGVLVGGNNVEAAKKTKKFIADGADSTIFEATFLANQCVAKADILKRGKSGWGAIEVKSKVKGEKKLKAKDEEYLINDMAYTVMVAREAGLDIVNCLLMLISKDYRLRMSDDKLFVDIDYTGEVLSRTQNFIECRKDVIKIITQDTQPKPQLSLDCRSCDLFKECLGKGIENHIFDLPRLSQKKFCELKELSVINIKDVPNDFDLTTNQIRVRDSVKQQEPIIDQDGLKNTIESILFPTYNLDFETVMTALPLYPNIAPYTQVPTQYSIHICDSPGRVTKHAEYLSQPQRDCRRELAGSLINDCGQNGSIIVYTHFESDRIKELAKLFLDLADSLQALLNRLCDLQAIISKHFYHPEFHGSFSIKKILPVLVPDLNYDSMDLSNGLDASATFAYLAKGEYNDEEAKQAKKALLEYCKLDTLAMVRLHQCLHHHI